MKSTPEMNKQKKEVEGHVNSAFSREHDDIPLPTLKYLNGKSDVKRNVDDYRL